MQTIESTTSNNRKCKTKHKLKHTKIIQQYIQNYLPFLHLLVQDTQAYRFAFLPRVR